MSIKRIKGKIIHIGQLVSGVSKAGKSWKKQEFVLETEEQYSKKVAFSVMNEKIDNAFIQMGQTVEIDVDAQSHEYNGKWYTELTAWRINNIGFVQQPQNQQPVYQQQAPQGYAPSVNPTNAQGQKASFQPDDVPF